MAFSRVLAVVVVAACGHFDFARTSDAGGDGTSDGTPDDATAGPGDGGGDGALQQDLLVYFPFDPAADQELYEQVSGTPATCENCPTLTADPAGIPGSAMLFDGNDCLHIAAPMDQHASFTFAAWVEGATQQASVVFARSPDGVASVDNVFAILIDANAGLQVSAGGASLSADVNDSFWHHIAGVVDSQGLRMYVDGVAGAGAPAMVVYPSTGTQSISLGCDYSGGIVSATAQVSIDEVRLYGRALTAAEIAELAE